MRKFLKKKVKELYEEEIDFYSLPYEIFEYADGWPEVKNIHNWLDVEVQDMENFEWLSIEEDKLIIWCGGDWQEPLKITLILKNNKLSVIDFWEAPFEEGLSEEEFNKKLELN
jgi:hypothetical protein